MKNKYFVMVFLFMKLKFNEIKFDLLDIFFFI